MNTSTFSLSFLARVSALFLISETLGIGCFNLSVAFHSKSFVSGIAGKLAR